MTKPWQHEVDGELFAEFVERRRGQETTDNAAVIMQQYDAAELEGYLLNAAFRRGPHDISCGPRALIPEEGEE